MKRLSILFYITTNIFHVTTSFPSWDRYIGHHSAYQSKYLCSIEPLEMKCCSCLEDCYENCCIDVFWNPDDYSLIDTYIDDFKSISIENFNEFNGICHPAFPWFEKGQRSESFITTIMYFDKEGNRYECPNAYSFSELPVYAFESQILYKSELCAILDGVTNYNYLNYTVYCKKENKMIYEGRTLNKSDLKQLNGCTFTVTDSIKATPCPNEVSACDNYNKHFVLCRAYSAPYNGYKNKYCSHCQNDFSEVESKYEMNCHLSLNGIKRINNNLIISNYTYRFELKVMGNFQLNVISDPNFKVVGYKTLFPVKEFLGIETFRSLDYSLDDLTEYRMCNRERKLDLDRDMCCDCDEKCFEFGTCCMDILWKETRVIDINTYKEMLIDRATKERPKYTCEWISTMEEVGVLVISKCLSDSSFDNKQKCDSYKNLPMVFADQKLFKNKYCAECNNVTVYEVVNWDISKDYQYQSGVFRKCKPILQNCQPGSYFYDLCNSYTSYFGPYKNIFCFLCSYDRNFSKKFDILRDCSWKIKLTWASLIEFNDYVKERMDEKVCSPGYVFDQTSKICLPKVDILNPNLDRCLSANGWNFFLQVGAKNNESEVMSQMKNLFETNMKVYYENEHKRIYKADINPNIQTIEDIIALFGNRNSIYKSDTVLMFTSIIKPLFNIDGARDFEFFDNFPYDRICYRIQLLPLKNLTFKSNCDIIVNETRYGWSNISIWIVANRMKTERFISICKKFYFTDRCQSTKVITNVSTLQNGTIIYNEKGNSFSYRIEEYKPVANGYEVCDEKSGANDFQIIEDIAIYITYVGTSISLIFYILIIITYSVYKELHKVPLLCTLAIAVCLCIGDLAFIMANIFEKVEINNAFVCKLIAIVIHFGVISGYSWNSVLAIDLMSTFLLFKGRAMNTDLRRFKIYCIVVFSLTTLIVTAAYITDYLEIAPIGYGDDGLCYPHKYWGRLYFYIVPLVISLGCSTIMLSLTLVGILHERKKVERVVRPNQNINVSVIAIKLIFVLGLSEGLGFIQIQDENQPSDAKMFLKIIALLYTCLRSFRGVILAVIYLFKKDICQLYISKFRKRRNNDTIEEIQN